MAKFGERLRQERKSRGITLEAMATSTKISTRMLAALEEEKFDLLPGGVFNRGFVRAYAKFVGIDEESAVADYLAASGLAETEPIEAVDPKLEKTLANWRRPESEGVGDRGSSWTAIAVLVLIGVSAFAGYRLISKRRAESRAGQGAVTVQRPVFPTALDAPETGLKTDNLTAPPAAVMASTPTSSSNSSAISKLRQNEAASTRSETNPIKRLPQEQKAVIESNVVSNSNAAVELMLKAKADSWISVTADGKLVLQDLLRAPAERSVKAREKVVVILGNAGGVDVSYNGKTLPAFGGDRQVKTVTFRADGYQ